MIAALGAAAALPSCHHKVFDEGMESGDIEVVFDWRHAPEASPRSMSVYFFPTGGGEPERYEITERNGGIVRVAYGSYHVMCFNSDTEYVRYRNTDSRETFEVYGRPASLLSGLSALGIMPPNPPRAEGTEDEEVCMSPDMMWSDCAEGVEIREAAGRQTITLYPKQCVSTYTVEIRNAENLKYASGLSGTLSSLAAGHHPAMGCDVVSAPRVTIPFDAAVSADKTTVTGGFLTFGHCPAEGARHTLTMYAVLADDSKWFYTYDVTDQVHSAPDQRNVHIVLDGLPLPKPIVNGGGINPSVDEWQDIIINMPMN